MKWLTPKAFAYTCDAECLPTLWGADGHQTTTWQALRLGEQAGQPTGARQPLSRAWLVLAVSPCDLLACSHLGLTALPPVPPPRCFGEIKSGALVLGFGWCCLPERSSTSVHSNNLKLEFSNGANIVCTQSHLQLRDPQRPNTLVLRPLQ